MKKIHSMVVLGAVALLSCSKLSPTPTFTPTCSSTAPSFKSTVLPAMRSVCSGCHSQFTNYSNIYQDQNSIRAYIVDGSMPRSGSLTTAQENAIICWIDSGAPNN